MARTRSQPISPGGYQSLPDKPTRRRITKRDSTKKAPATTSTTTRRPVTRSTSVDVEIKVAKEKKLADKPAPPITSSSSTTTTTTRRRATRSTSVDVEIKVAKEKKLADKPAPPITSSTSTTATTTRRRATRATSVDVEIKVAKEKTLADKPAPPTTTSTNSRPRTRSQPLSPNGLQVFVPKPRQRRSASVDQPENELSIAKKAPVKKTAGRKVNQVSFPSLLVKKDTLANQLYQQTRVTKKRAPKTKTSNKRLSETKNTNTRTDEVLRPISATPIRRNTTTRRFRSGADFDSPRTLFSLEETVNVQLGHQTPSPKSPPANNYQVTSEIASPHTPLPANQVPKTPSPPRTMPASTNRASPGWTQLRHIYNSVTRRWGTIKNRIGRRGSNGARPTSPEGVEASTSEPHSPQQAPNVHSESEPFPAITEEMALSSPLRPITAAPPSVLDRRTRRATRTRSTYDYSIRGSGFSEQVLKNCYKSNKRLSPPFPGLDLPEANQNTAQSTSDTLPVINNDIDSNKSLFTPPPQPCTPQANKTTEIISPDAPKKRKRRSSPDIIPNPPGASYGMADGFFDFDSDDEKEAMEEQARRDAAKNPDGPPTKKQDMHGARRRHILHPDDPRPAEDRDGYDHERERLYMPTPLETISSDLLSEGDFGAFNKAPNGPTLTFQTPYSISSNSTDVEGGAAHSSPLGPLGVAGPTIVFQTPYSDSSSDKEESPSTQVDADGDSSLSLDLPGMSH